MRTFLLCLLLPFSVACHSAVTLTEFGGILDRDALGFTGDLLVDWDAESLVFWEVRIEDGTVLSSNDWPADQVFINARGGSLSASADGIFTLLLDFLGTNHGPEFWFADWAEIADHCAPPTPLCPSNLNPGFFGGSITSIDGVSVAPAAVPIPAALPLFVSALIGGVGMGYSRKN